MSRAHAFAPGRVADESRQPQATAPRPVGRDARPARHEPGTTAYLERAMLLWPRLDRAALRRAGDDPSRIAELVVRRTAQPLDVILAMLTRQPQTALAITPAAPASAARDEAGRERERVRVALRVVGDDEAAAVGNLETAAC